MSLLPERWAKGLRRRGGGPDDFLRKPPEVLCKEGGLFSLHPSGAAGRPLFPSTGVRPGPPAAVLGKGFLSVFVEEGGRTACCWLAALPPPPPSCVSTCCTCSFKARVSLHFKMGAT